jgi:hypothetical protein
MGVEGCWGWMGMMKCVQKLMFDGPGLRCSMLSMVRSTKSTENVHVYTEYH